MDSERFGADGCVVERALRSGSEPSCFYLDESVSKVLGQRSWYLIHSYSLVPFFARRWAASYAARSRA